MKILIIDDDPVTTRLFSEYLQDYGKISTAMDGEEGLEAIKHSLENSDPYNLICLDIMMPMIDGIETLKNIRDLEKSILGLSGQPAKIIMTTAVDDIKTVLKAFNELCDGYLTKPINKADLAGEMSKIGLL